MNLFKRLFGKKNKSAAERMLDEPYSDDWEPEGIGKALESDSDDLLPPEPADLYDEDTREKYVRTLLDQMQEASRSLEELSREYNLVTGYLTDMEEIEQLPDRERETLENNARLFLKLENDRLNRPTGESHMADEEYHRIERMENEIQSGIEKLKEAEEYQRVIKRDLKKLDNERKYYSYRKSELTLGRNNLKGIGMIGLVSMIICMVLLVILQLGFGLETTIGYLLVACVAVVFVTVIYVKYTDSFREEQKLFSLENKVILLQNKVKIRYVNNTNLLDYLYMKYSVPTAETLEKQWKDYCIEKEEREKRRKEADDLEFYKKNILDLLKRIRLRDPFIWLHQPEALVDHREMVEIRHNLIGRRQKLRKQMDMDREIANNCQKRIKNLVEAYPAFAKNILSFIDTYEEI